MTSAFWFNAGMHSTSEDSERLSAHLIPADTQPGAPADRRRVPGPFHRPRLLLDSNIWRYLVDAGAVTEVQLRAKRANRDIVIAPAVLYEAALLKDERKRSELLNAMRRPCWKRLMPEAYSEAEELKGEIRRLRPEWLRENTNLERYKRIRFDWTRSRNGLWDRVHKDTHILQRFDEGLGERARRAAYDVRENAKDVFSPSLAEKWRKATLTKTTAKFTKPIPGWNGEAIEVWRVAAMEVFKGSMADSQHATRDWIQDEINIAIMLSEAESFGRFWCHEIEVMAMQRAWLRWAFEFLQSLHAVTPGTPGDSQLATYLVEADWVLSADKIFIRIAEKVKNDAPFGMAAPVRVPALQARDFVLDFIMRS